MTPSIGPDRLFDVRALPCSEKHGLIVRTFMELPVGDYFVLINGHDPERLQQQFSAQWPGTFTWEHLLRTPDEVRVRITKTRALEAAAPAFFGDCGH